MTTENLNLLPKNKLKFSEKYSDASDVVLFHGDRLDFMKSLPSKSVKLVITSPPYNIGKAYEKRKDLDLYLAEQEESFKECVRILDDQGSLCWQVGNHIAKDGEVFPLDTLLYPIGKKFGLKLRNRIIWHFGHGLHSTYRFSGRHESILWFTKTDDYTFNLDPVRVPSKYPGKRHYKGPHKGKPSGNPQGKNPSDIWEIVAQDWELAIWDIPNVKSNHIEKTIHPCQFPIELVERCVLALTDKNDSVFDPYAGVGSSIIAAVKHERRAIGCEKEAEYIEIARDRIHQFYNGQLKMRPLGKPVHEPSGNEKVAQLPDEWKTEDGE